MLYYRTRNSFSAMRKDLFNLGPVFGYFFRKNDPSRPANFNLRTMHFINKLSLAMFLVGFMVLLYRWFIR